MTVVETRPNSSDSPDTLAGPDTVEIKGNPERDRLQSEILDRMILSFRASQTQQPLPSQSYNPWFEQRISVMTAMAKLFLGFPIPFWPPGLLLRKMVRRLVLPLFAPQVEFNTAARDVILEMRQRSEAQSAALQDTVQQIGRLEAHIEVLTAQIEDLAHKDNSSCIKK